MVRRADPERIFRARRIATRNGLTDYGMPREDAERWCDSWEAEAARLELPKDKIYWTVGAAWIAEQRSERRKPG
jgi:hypothetical protein